MQVEKKESEVAKLTLLLEQCDGSQSELQKRIQGTLTEIGQLKDEKSHLESVLGEGNYVDRTVNILLDPDFGGWSYTYIVVSVYFHL